MADVENYNFSVWALARSRLILGVLHYGGIDRNLAVTDRKKWWALWFYGQINLPT